MAANATIAAGRLQAEAVRYLESMGRPPPPTDDAAACAEARRAAGTAELKVIARARALPTAAAIATEIAHMWTVLRGLIVILFVMAVAAGAATARTAFDTIDGTTVNFFWMLASLLGLHLLSFLIWLVLLATPGLSQGGTLGRGVLWLWRQASGRFGTNNDRTAALQAVGARYGMGRAGRWLASSLSHGLWLGYLAGATLMALALLSAQHYTFVWETTILDAAAYASLTQWLAALPAALGIAVPDQAAVAAAEWPGSPDTANQTLWSSLLIAALILYGLMPRALALAVSVMLTRRGAATTPLDLTHPYYAELAARLAPAVTATRVIDGDGDRPAASVPLPNLPDLPPPPPAGPVFLLGWEIDSPLAGWPPPGTDTAVHDLGRRDSRAELERAVAVIGSAGRAPGRVLVVVDLRQTPDRGITAVIESLHVAAVGRVVLLLTGGAAMQRRMSTPDAAGDRLADWVAAGLAAGVEVDHMVAIDLDRSPEALRPLLAKITRAAA